MNSINHNKRIIKNTIMLYFRQVLIIIINLFTVRVLLNTIGVINYGIYNVVAGIVTMFSFLSNSMSTASQRYFSFEIGQGNNKQLRKTFNIIFFIYLLISVLILLFAETIGLWFLNNKLIIPENRIVAAAWVYQFSIASSIITILTIPYMAFIIAHEDMKIFAYVSIIEVVLKLAVVYILQLLTVDKLKLYGFLVFVVTLINTGIYRYICIKRYEECKFRFYWDFFLFREIFTYVGWSFFGAISNVARNQGINILLNMYFGPIVNTARAIARQIDSAVLSFTQNFFTAVRPQIVKFYSTGEKEQMLLLVFRSTKMIFFLLFIFILPLELELPIVILLWLKQIPDYVIIFTQLMLINALIDYISFPLMGASQATGKIKLYQIIVSGVLLLNLPISLILLYYEKSVIHVLLLGITLSLFAFIARLVILSKQLQFSIYIYIKIVLIPILLVAITGSILPIIFVFTYPNGIVRLFLTVIISSISIIASIFFIGLSIEERIIVKRVIYRYKKKIFNK
jgi:O-antigen/teichoic acid export membrane protein